MRITCSQCGQAGRNLTVRVQASYRLRTGDRRIYTCQDCLSAGEYRQEQARQARMQEVKLEASRIWLDMNPDKTEADLPEALR